MPTDVPESEAEILNRLNQTFKEQMQELNSWYSKEVSKIDKSITLIQYDSVGSCEITDASTEWPSNALVSNSPENMSRMSSRCYECRSPPQNWSTSSPSSVLPFSSAVTPFEPTGASACFSPNRTSLGTNRRPSLFTSPNLPGQNDSADGEMASHLNIWCTLANVWGLWYAPPPFTPVTTSRLQQTSQQDPRAALRCPPYLLR
jgi:hypothetical protein